MLRARPASVLPRHRRAAGAARGLVRWCADAGLARQCGGAAADLPEATLPEVVVQARRAEAARQGILARFGAREYQVDRGTIEALPGGANQPLNQVLLQTPGVVQDSFGDIHVRGEHRNLQYRINGVQLPEGLQGFGQVFDARSLRSVSVLTGALPAQFGFRTNAVINLETRTGALDPGGVGRALRRQLRHGPAACELCRRGRRLGPLRHRHLPAERPRGGEPDAGPDGAEQRDGAVARPPLRARGSSTRRRGSRSWRARR